MLLRRRHTAILGLLSLMALSCLSATTLAEDGTTSGVETIPPALKGYKGREIAVTMHYEGAPWLTRESREREEDCTTLLKALNVKKGQTVCDLGCGNGFYTLKLAELVGDQGHVLAVDIQPEMLTLLKERAKDADATNVQPILGSLIDPKLPKGGVDLILLVDVYHEFSHPEHMLRAMREALTPDGRMALVEFRLEDPKVPIKLLHKMSKKQIMKEVPPNGFKLIEQFDKLPWQHVMFFARDDAPQLEVTITEKTR
jgi:ubiquinone/menaquinone biosynthesis C-methylase UbiE